MSERGSRAPGPHIEEPEVRRFGFGAEIAKARSTSAPACCIRCSRALETAGWLKSEWK